MSTNGTALTVLPAVTSANASTALEPSTAEQAFWLATQLAKSGLLGRIQRPEAAFAIILCGRELGLTAMQSLRSIHIIEGKPTLSADLMAALVIRSPLCKYFRLVESTNQVARYETLRTSTDKPTVMSFTWEEAKTAGLINKNNWKAHPAAMLRARCIAALARVAYPDLLVGIYEEDEISEPKQMPAVREALPSAPVQEQGPDDGVDGEVFDLWSGRLYSAPDPEALEAVRVDCKAQVPQGPTLDAIAKAYAAAKKKFTTEPKEN